MSNALTGYALKLEASWKRTISDTENAENIPPKRFKKSVTWAEDTRLCQVRVYQREVMVEWNPQLITELKTVSERGANSKERKLQAEREAAVQPTIYMNKNSIPDNPSEEGVDSNNWDFDLWEQTEPRIIPYHAIKDDDPKEEDEDEPANIDDEDDSCLYDIDD